MASWWDYGYQTTAMANRTVIVDNNTWNNTHIATVGRAMSSPERKAWQIYRSLDVDYVLVVFGGFIGCAAWRPRVCAAASFLRPVPACQPAAAWPLPWAVLLGAHALCLPGRALAHACQQHSMRMPSLDLGCRYPSDDINKFLWMVRIGGGVFPEIKEKDYLGNGNYRVDSQAGKVRAGPHACWPRCQPRALAAPAVPLKASRACKDGLCCCCMLLAAR